MFHGPFMTRVRRPVELWVGSGRHGKVGVEGVQGHTPLVTETVRKRMKGLGIEGE